eukprot:1205027-Alexandrium_andersonii.AAC.1
MEALRPKQAEQAPGSPRAGLCLVVAPRDCPGDAVLLQALMESWDLEASMWCELRAAVRRPRGSSAEARATAPGPPQIYIPRGLVTDGGAK